MFPGIVRQRLLATAVGCYYFAAVAGLSLAQPLQNNAIDLGPKIQEVENAFQKNVSFTEVLQLLDDLPEDEVARSLHLTVRQDPVQYVRPGYVELMRSLGAAALGSNDPVAREMHVAAVSRLRSVVFFDTHRGYVDCDVAVPGENQLLRGPRNIACRLQALRALEGIVPVAEQQSICSQQEVNRAVLEFNPTYVASGRTDPELQARGDMTLSQRLQMTLYTALLHFPTDPDTTMLLAASVADYRPGPVRDQAVLPTYVAIFAYNLCMSPPELQAEVLALFDEEYLYDRVRLNWPLAIRLPAELFRELLLRVRLSDYRYLPEGWDKKIGYQELVAGLSRSRQEAIDDAFTIAARLISVPTPDHYQELPDQMNQGLYLRSSWLPRFAEAGELEKQAAVLRHIGERFVYQFELAVPWTEYFPIDDKVALCYRLLIAYDSLAQTVNDPRYDDSIARLRKRLNSEPHSLFQKMRTNAVSWLIYERYKDPKTNSIDFKLYEDKFKNPPEEITDRAFKLVDDRQIAFLKGLNHRLREDRRPAVRYRLYRELGFHITVIKPVADADDTSTEPTRKAAKKSAGAVP